MQLQCDLCSKQIETNEPHNTINFHRERRNGNSVTVDFAETILTTCINCGRNINKEAIVRILAHPSKEKARMFGELFIPMEVN
ncbi:MAG: hypothetical protein ACJATI_003223 [Halioglobus sp.]|jgi:hypothetical protein